MKIPRIIIGEGFRNPPLDRPHLILIIYDAAVISDINERRIRGASEITIPAKYAVCWHKGADADMVIGQVMAFEQSRGQTEWFKKWHDLPTAIQALRDRHPELNLPEQIDHVIDWPT